MPELPDIEIYLQALTARIKGATLNDARIGNALFLRTAEPALAAIMGQQVTALQRVGKRLAFEFSNEHCQTGGRGLKDQALSSSNGNKQPSGEFFSPKAVLLTGDLRICWRWTIGSIDYATASGPRTMGPMTVQAHAKSWSCALAAAVLCGCSASVPVEATFPQPLIEAISMRVGLLFDSELTSFEYEEQLPQSSKWSIQLGDANVAMFDPLFNSMFTYTRSVSDVTLAEGQRDSVDVIIKPLVDKFEFDIPSGPDSKFVEVWVRYKLQVYQPDGKLVLDWPVVGYGKAETGRISNEGSLHRAAVRALREVGANVATEFATQPELGPWLEGNRDEAQLPTDQLPQG